MLTAKGYQVGALRDNDETLIAFRRLSSKLVSVQEEERRRIAKELHDSIGSSLSSVKFYLESLCVQLNPTSQHIGSTEKATNMLQKAIEIVQETIEEARRLVCDLRPPMLDDLGLCASIGWYCRRFQTIYPRISVKHVLGIREEKIPEHLKIVMFRVMQEALNNTAKYSEAEAVTITLISRGGALTISVMDNGKGFDLASVSAVSEPDRGLGLTSMRERTEFSGGVFVIESTRGAGTTVSATWVIDTSH